MTSDNVNTFFLESAKASKGCNGAQCNSSYTFEFKNLNYVTEINRMSTLTPNSTILWNFYEGDKQTVSAIGNHNEGQYALKYTLKDGRVLTSAWIKF